MTAKNDDPATKCGYVALLGRPNVGKSTLLNQLVGKKISITSRKPQTTRHRLLGILSEEDTQIIFVDTPGLHRRSEPLNRYMNRQAMSVLHDVDVIFFIVEALQWTELDTWILEKLKTAQMPVFLLINKVDTAKNKDLLLPFIENCKARFDFQAIIPISAKTGNNLEAVRRCIQDLLPHNPFFFPDLETTDRQASFMAAEFLREQLFRLTGEELPYATTVEIEQFKEDETLITINALIWVAREGQKKIIIGQKGQHLKKIATLARESMEAYFDKKVFLEVWIKVKENWMGTHDSIARLGYRDEY